MYSVGYREAVLDYYDNGHTYRETCSEFQINSATLSSWIKRKKEFGSPKANYCGTEPKIDREKLKKYVGTQMHIKEKSLKYLTAHSLQSVTT